MTYFEAKRHFDKYVKSPKTTAIVLFVLIFIWAIIDSAVFKVEVGYNPFTHSHDYLYGTFRVPSGFLNWLIWIAIGTVFIIVVYSIAKNIVSYQFLIVSNLEVISKISDIESLVIEEQVSDNDDYDNDYQEDSQVDDVDFMEESDFDDEDSVQEETDCKNK